MNGCRVPIAKIEASIIKCKTLVMPPQESLTPAEFNFVASYLRDAKPILEAKLNEIPADINQ